MKGLNLKALCLLSFFYLGCEPEVIIKEVPVYPEHEPCRADPAPIWHPGEMLTGRVAGLKNCLPFMASAQLNFFDFDGGLGTVLIMATYKDWGNQFVIHETISLGVPSQYIGTHSMYFPQAEEYLASYGTVQDFDVLEDVFDLDKNYSKNEITFDIINNVEGYARGVFNCRFLLASNNPSGHNPDTVIFTNCYFEAWEK